MGKDFPTEREMKIVKDGKASNNLKTLLTHSTIYECTNKEHKEREATRKNDNILQSWDELDLTTFLS